MNPKASVVMLEVWRNHPKIDGYQASNLGRIRSKPRITIQGNRWGHHHFVPVKGKVLSPALNDKGRRVFRAHGKTVNASTFIWECWKGLRPKGLQVAHNDGVAHRDRLSNLRLATAKDNAADRVKHGGQSRLFGEGNPLTKITSETVDKIRKATGSYSYIASVFGVSSEQVSRIKRGLSRKNG